MSETKESDRLRAEVDALRDQIAEATARQQAAERASAEGISVARLTAERDKLKSQLAALNASALPASTPASKPAPVVETATDSPSGH